MKENNASLKLSKKRTLLDILREEKLSKYKGGIYHKTQIELTYNSNHIEGNSLTRSQTRYIFETNSVLLKEKENILNVDDIIEISNHFNLVNMIIDNAEKKLTQSFIKKLHFILKNGTSSSRKEYFNVGDYKKVPNEIGDGIETTLPKDVKKEMQKLLASYNKISKVTLKDIINFHVNFERIHPFQDGNGRIGRLIMFKECLKYNIVPFIIDDKHKLYYYRGLQEWDREKGYLTSTILAMQDKYKEWLKFFKIKY